MTEPHHDRARSKAPAALLVLIAPAVLAVVAVLACGAAGDAKAPRGEATAASSQSPPTPPRAAEDLRAWRDTGVRLQGPIVNQVQSIFAHHRVEETGEVLIGEQCFPHLEKAGEIRVRSRTGDARNFHRGAGRWVASPRSLA